MQKIRLLILTILCSTFGFSQFAEFSIESALNSPMTFGEPEYGTDGVTEGTLYSNGPYFNVAGSPDVSFLQDATLGMGTYGFGHALSSGYRVADDWVVAEDVEVESFQFYAYQTGSTTTSTINFVSLAIWDGDPSNPASTIVWGDQTTNVLTSSEWSGAYRQLESTPGDTGRPIMISTVETPGLTLAPGTYWLDWQTGGTLASGPWAPPITITGQSNTGNGKQFDAVALAWIDALDVNPQGFPFEVNGEVVGGGGGGNCDLDGNTTTGEIWDRPLETGTGMSGVGIGVRYNVYGPFTVDTAGVYTISSTQTGWDGFLFVYQDNFDPNDPLTNFVAGDDDGPGGIGTSEVMPNLAVGTEYFIITTGFDPSDFGPYTTTITGPGTYTCDGGSEPGGECEQGIPSADEIFEGYNITLGNAFRSAEDFTVEAGTMFTLETITVDVNNLTSPNEATILIREDNAGIPGAILHTISGGPDDSEVVGTGFGEPVYHLTFNLDTPIELTEGTYWIDPKMSATTGETIWWATITDSSHGSDPYRSNDDGATWTADVGAGSIFTVSGTCEDDVPPGDNDDCDGAIAVSCGDSVSGTTADATDSGGNAAPDRFYSFTGDGTVQNVTLSLCNGSDYDTYLRVFSDCTLSNEIAFNDDFCGLQSQLTFESDGTSTYIIMVEGFGSNSGNYSLEVTCSTPPVVEEPDYPCFQGDGLASNGFENGYNVTAGGTFRNADDFIVDDTFTMQYVRMNIFMLPGDTASSVTFNVRADEGGAPSESNIVDSFTATPTSQAVLGTNFGYDISQVEFVLDADRPELAAGTYWLQPEVTDGGGVAFWEVTSTGSLGSFVHTSESGGPWNSDPENMQAVFFVAGVCGDTQPVDCNQEVLSNALENGSFLGGDTDQRLAIDLTVDADTQMTIAAIEPTIIIPEGGQATTFSFIFYEDNAGLPGAEVANVDGTITSSTVTGQNFGRDFIRYAVDLNTPVILDTGTYWMEMTSDAEGWETTTASVIGSPLIFNSTTTSGEWIVTSSGAELVYEIVATCETLGVSDMDAFDFAYYPNPVKDVLNINSKKQVENIAVFNLAGQQVLVKSQIANGQINVASLPTGVYIFKATLQGGQVETFKIVKK